jgi:hypothetical protein
MNIHADLSLMARICQITDKPRPYPNQGNIIVFLSDKGKTTCQPALISVMF